MYGIPVEVEAFDIESNLLVRSDRKILFIGLNPNMAFKSASF